MSNKKESCNLVFTFDNEEAKKQFALWLCEQGEQDYWQWMECVEQDEPKGNITGIRFDYFNGSKQFIGNNNVKVECGRMDSEE